MLKRVVETLGAGGGGWEVKSMAENANATIAMKARKLYFLIQHCKNKISDIMVFDLIVLLGLVKFIVY